MKENYFYAQQTTDVNNVLGYGLLYEINEFYSSEVFGRCMIFNGLNALVNFIWKL